MYVRFTVSSQAAARLLRSKEFNRYYEDEREDERVVLVAESEDYLEDRFDYLINHKISFAGAHGPDGEVNDRLFAFLAGDTEDVVYTDCDVDLNPFILVDDLRHEHRVEQHIRAFKTYCAAANRAGDYSETLETLISLRDKIWGSKDSAEITLTIGIENGPIVSASKFMEYDSDDLAREAVLQIASTAADGSIANGERVDECHLYGLVLRDSNGDERKELDYVYKREDADTLGIFDLVDGESLSSYTYLGRVY